MTRFKIKVLVLFLLVFTGMNAQIGVGIKVPNPDAMLDVSATNKGLLLPRITLSSTMSASPLNNLIAGMTVYNTATTGDVTPGYYYCDGVKWVKINAVSIPDATTTLMGKIQLAGDLGGTASLPTVPGLTLKVDKEAGKGLSSNDYTTAEKAKLTAIDMSTKQDVSNISNSIVSDASSVTKYPSVKGIKDYVDGLSSAGGVADGSITSFKIADNAIVNADVSPTAAIDFGKLNISKSNILGLGILKSDIGLANVDNTTDLVKPISTATQSALDLKANTADVSSSLALKANLASPTFTGTVSGIDKIMVGLSNVDNTTDLAKPISTATQTALNLKANTTDVSTSLGLKEDSANKTLDLTTADGASDVKFPSAKAVKTYSDAKVVDAITDGVTTSAPTQNAVFDALALKASKVEITSTEIALPTKINAKQLFSISGTLTVVSGTRATIPAITGLQNYYSIRVFKDGKPFRNEVRSFTNGTPIEIITGNGMMSEIYPSGTYTYVLEYFK